MADGSPWRRLRRIVRQDPAREVDDELEFHLEERVRDYAVRGMDPEAARKAALALIAQMARRNARTYRPANPVSVTPAAA